jgi:tetratricopeptide (TPR) repeat protein
MPPVTGTAAARRCWRAAAASVAALLVLGPAAALEPLRPQARPGLSDPATAADPRGPSAGTYLAARAAARAHDFAAAAALHDQALAEAPDDPLLLGTAVLARLALGDIDGARPLADRLVALGEAGPLAHLVRLAAAAREGRWRDVLAEQEAGRGAGPLIDGLARGWARLALGDPAGASAAFGDLAADRGIRGFAMTHKALALAAGGELEAAAAILGSPDLPVTRRGLLAEAQILSALGRQDQALARIEAVLGPAPDPVFDDIRARLQGGEAVPFDVAPTAAAGLAEALHGVAAALSGEDGDNTAALVYARAALALKPRHAEAALLAADLLLGLGQTRLAAETFALVPADHPAYAEAEIGRATTLRRAGEPEAAIEVLQALARARPEDPWVPATLGDHLRALERWAEAEAAYGRAIGLSPEGAPLLWFVHYTRAIARQAQDDWPGTEADLRRALELSPDEPRLLNHLGYSLVERGERLPEALAMIERAVAAEPDNGAIVDSLGWAFFKLGRYAEAVVQLERAVTLLPTHPVINDHLGDAYWMVGREREARFQWRRALSLGPEPEEAERIRRKLELGLDAVRREEALPPPPPDAAGGEGG